MDSKELLKKEKEYLSKVKKILQSKINDLSESLEGKKKGISELKRFMWENLNDYTDEERAIALYEVDKSVDLTNINIDTLNRYEKALQSPYFAKVTFKEDGYDDTLDIYVGICTVQEKYKFYVFDWRSPISSMFYNYEVGKAKYNTPNGEISGEITSKMQFKIVDGNLIRCFNSNINIDDEYLQEILANSSTEKMKNIVSTIQREQNLIIRNEKDKYLIVQGSAGSGKTSVALHRIAYLLYRDHRLNYNNVLILSPNEVFSDYISDVLPELGETNVLKTTFSDFAQTFLKPYKNIESYAEFLERMYSTNNYNKDIIKYKMSDNYKEDIDSYFEKRDSKITFNESIKYYDLEVTKEELLYLYSIKYKKFSFKERIDSMISDICLKLHISYKKYYNEIKNRLLKISNINLNIFDLYEDFLNESNIKEERKSKRINYEDITPLVYIYFKVNGYPIYNDIKQVVIDEVQDYTYFQLEVLKTIFKNASFTILGDVNQIINPYYSYDSLKELSTLFKNSNYLELSKTYRSSEEIIEYSNKILGINNACAVRRNNNIPVKVMDVEDTELSSSIKNDIDSIKNNNFRRIAIITKNINVAKKVHKLLSDSSIQLLTKSEDSLNSDVIIIPSYLAKGLEFDAVIAYNDANENYTEEEGKLYYVVCTRAQHQLNVYNEPRQLIRK